MTIIYGNTIKPYLNRYYKLREKLDSIFIFEGQKDTMFRNVDLKLGMIDFGNHNMAYLKDFGYNIPHDSINTISEKLIGTVGPDIFQGIKF